MAEHVVVNPLQMNGNVGERRGRKRETQGLGRTHDQMEVCLDENGFLLSAQFICLWLYLISFSRDPWVAYPHSFVSFSARCHSLSPEVTVFVYLLSETSLSDYLLDWLQVKISSSFWLNQVSPADFEYLVSLWAVPGASGVCEPTKLRTFVFRINFGLLGLTSKHPGFVEVIFPIYVRNLNY